MPALDTTYLGLALRSPIVASAGPLTGDPDTAARLADAGAGATRAALAVRGGDRPRAGRADVGAGSRRRALRRGDRLLPGASRTSRAPSTATWPTSSAPRRSVSVPGDRQPQRARHPADGRATPACSATPAPTPSSSTSTGWRPIRPAAPSRWKTTTSPSSPTSRPPSTSRWRSSCRRSTRRWPTSPCRAVQAGRRRARPVQPLLPTRPRRRHARDRSASRAVVARGSCACRCAGSPSSARCCTGQASLAATSGVETGADVAKALLVGADVAMTTSAVLRHGPDHLRVIEEDLVGWMTDHDYDSVAQLRGSVSIRHGRRPVRLRAGELRAYAALVDVTGHGVGERVGRPSRGRGSRLSIRFRPGG